MSTTPVEHAQLQTAVRKARLSGDDLSMDHLNAVYEAAQQLVDARATSGPPRRLASSADLDMADKHGTRAPEVVGNTHAVVASFLETWLAQADARVEASPAEHLDAMINEAIRTGALRRVDGSTSDGFHTFDDLYRHRMLLNAALFQAWHRIGTEYADVDYDVHKSLLHHDGEAPFGGTWFIVVAQLPTGQISYHYGLEHWDLFDVPDRRLAAEWDGHTSAQAADRLQAFLEDQL